MSRHQRLLKPHDGWGTPQICQVPSIPTNPNDHPSAFPVSYGEEQFSEDARGRHWICRRDVSLLPFGPFLPRMGHVPTLNRWRCIHSLALDIYMINTW
jgi:hypothetical protein